MIGVLVKIIICGILPRVIVKAIKHVKLMNFEILKIVHAKNVKRLFGKLVLECAEEILNTTETLMIRTVTCEKSNCLIHTILLLLLFAFQLSSCQWRYLDLYLKSVLKDILFINSFVF